MIRPGAVGSTRRSKGRMVRSDGETPRYGYQAVSGKIVTVIAISARTN